MSRESFSPPGVTAPGVLSLVRVSRLAAGAHLLRVKRVQRRSCMAEEIPPAHGLALGHFYRKRGLTPTQAAGRLGLADTGTLRKLEKGIVKLSRETLDEKAGRLGFTPEDVDAFLFADR